MLSTQHASKHWEIDDNSYVVVNGCHVSKRSIKMSLSYFCLMILARIKYMRCARNVRRASRGALTCSSVFAENARIRELYPYNIEIIF